MTLAELDAAIKAVCPAYGISIGRKGDKDTWRIDFTKDATDKQKKAAQDILTACTLTDPQPEPRIYYESGALKVKFANGIVKTLATDQ